MGNYVETSNGRCRRPYHHISLNGEFPEALNRFISKAMAKLPNNRHPSMQEFVEELDEIISPGEDRKQDKTIFLKKRDMNFVHD